MSPFQLVVVPIVALLFLRSVVRFVRRDGPRLLSGGMAAVWLAAGLALYAPDLTTHIAKLLGIGRGADLLLYLFALSFLAALFVVLQKLRRLDLELTEIVRHIAVREARPPGNHEPP